MKISDTNLRNVEWGFEKEDENPVEKPIEVKYDDKKSVSIQKPAKQHKNKEMICHELYEMLHHNLECEFYHSALIACQTPYLPIKLFLAVFLIVGAGLAAYTNINLVFSYLDYGVITTQRKVS